MTHADRRHLYTTHAQTCHTIRPAKQSGHLLKVLRVAVSPKCLLYLKRQWPGAGPWRVTVELATGRPWWGAGLGPGAELQDAGDKDPPSPDSAEAPWLLPTLSSHSRRPLGTRVGKAGAARSLVAQPGYFVPFSRRAGPHQEGLTCSLLSVPGSRVHDCGQMSQLPGLSPVPSLC